MEPIHFIFIPSVIGLVIVFLLLFLGRTEEEEEERLEAWQTGCRGCTSTPANGASGQPV